MLFTDFAASSSRPISHHSDLARLVARTKDQRMARIELHHLLTLKVVDALK